MFSANENLQLRQHKRKVVGWVEATMSEDVLDEGVNVMVMQVSCKAPGCVPLETAIIVIFPKSNKELLPGLPESNGGGSYKTKVLKPLAEVTKEDVLEALPPAFEGGKRSMERLCIQARDVMLGQITQLFGDDDVEGRKLMAVYLQESLQTYIDGGCNPPEWGEPFPEQKGISATDRVPTTGAASEQEERSEAATKVTTSVGNLVIKRPVDEDKPRAASLPMQSVTSPAVSSVNTVTRRRQQQAAERLLAGSASTLQRLSEREHAPGLRRPGCPCCDPDNPINVVDQLMKL